MERKKILFFISGPVPSPENMTAANKLSDMATLICFRNALQVTQTDSLEKCDGVAGDVPARYAAKFKRIDDPVLPGLEVAPTILPVEITDGDVKAFSELTIEAIVSMVQRKEITRDRALELEKRGKNRTTAVQRLSETVD